MILQADDRLPARLSLVAGNEGSEVGGLQRWRPTTRSARHKLAQFVKRHDHLLQPHPDSPDGAFPANVPAASFAAEAERHRLCRTPPPSARAPTQRAIAVCEGGVRVTRVDRFLL